MAMGMEAINEEARTALDKGARPSEINRAVGVFDLIAHNLFQVKHNFL
jgi:uncharacterized protein (UPF0262 family)